MSWTDPNFITREDVGTAYRKAKVDLYYERDHCDPMLVVQYEEDLEVNLESLYKRLNKKSLKWMTTDDIVGDWSVIPKGISSPSKESTSGWRPGDPDLVWEQVAARERLTASFRVVGEHSIDLQVIGALWIMKVGHLFDARLGDGAYGSRLRREFTEDADVEIGDLNEHALGSFKPYLRPYKSWKEDGVGAMKAALEGDSSIVVATLDLTEFYHRLNRGFILEPTYLSAIGLTLTQDQQRLTEALLAALGAWAKKTPLYDRTRPLVGIPVGLPVCRLLANVALAELDQQIMQGVAPLHYGRYVDDIILVLRDNKQFSGVESVWAYLKSRVPLLRSEGEKLSIQAPYLGAGGLQFGPSKQRVFSLKGESGRVLVDSLEAEMDKQSSEWRSLPTLPREPEQLMASMVAAIGHDGHVANNLRLVEAVSLRRAELAFKVRDAEAYLHDLPLESWKSLRKTLLKAAANHLVVLPTFFDMFGYLYRLVSIGVAGRDYEEVEQIVKRLIEMVNRVQRDCLIRLAGPEPNPDTAAVIPKWKERLARDVRNYSLSALGSAHRRDKRQLDHMLTLLEELCPATAPVTASVALLWGERLFAHDLGRSAFRLRYFPYADELRLPRLTQVPSLPLGQRFFDSRVVRGAGDFNRRLRKTGGESGKQPPLAFICPTRPFSPPELYLLEPRSMRSESEGSVRDWIFAFRGYSPKGPLPRTTRSRTKNGPEVLHVPFAEKKDRYIVAISSFLTKEASWTARVLGKSDPDLRRYWRFNRLLNQMRDGDANPDYVVLPELSIPSRWFVRAARRLATGGTSLIAGVEYLRHGKSTVTNQVWASLMTNCFGYQCSVVYRQEKASPALHEEDLLFKIGGLTLRPMHAPAWKPVVAHGGIRFGLLICSELTNIDFRSAFRGLVDAVFVPEWNQDTEHFRSIVEASASDIHAYVIQCNNRQFGDSRIRGPLRETWARDIVQVKGGTEDYYVTGILEVGQLRQFQSTHRSACDGEFKPVPDGFVFDSDRFQLPRKRDKGGS